MPAAATPSATARFAARFPRAQDNRFFRQAQGLTVSSLGLGTYLGPMTDEADASYTSAILAAVEDGINFLDTSLNYRHQRSELAIGAALRQMSERREELVLCTKAGYLVPGATPKLPETDTVGGMHSMAPAFLEDQLTRSLENLGVETIDVFYLHKPETQLRYIDPETFYKRIAAAFERLESFAAAGRIRYYGAATWDGFRRNGQPDGLSLARLSALARGIGGDAHHFRFIQLPFNLAMVEAYGQRAETRDGQRINVFEAARRDDITVAASAALLQSRLASGLPGQLAEKLEAPGPDAIRAIQFARSAPGITTALVGMGNPGHVRENLAIASCPPLSAAKFESLFSA
ncbi:MAG: aldo/keto reductase [Bryobacterales bacterium]|nr:aldo/keto reductase [Bryobacterales bacterium]